MPRKLIRRECPRCEELQPESEFYYYYSACKDCLRKKRKEYIQRIGPEVYKARCREYTAKYRNSLKPGGKRK